MPATRCVFCEILNGEKETTLVCENHGAIAIIDPRQANPGHVLIIPKEHTPDIYALSDEAGFATMQCLVRVSRAVKEAFEAEGLSVWQSNGEAAGQEVPHVHFHILPRKADDGLLKVYPHRIENTPMETRKAYARKIQAFL